MRVKFFRITVGIHRQDSEVVQAISSRIRHLIPPWEAFESLISVRYSFPNIVIGFVA